jgi:hypothetical protein
MDVCDFFNCKFSLFSGQGLAAALAFDIFESGSEVEPVSCGSGS